MGKAASCLGVERLFGRSRGDSTKKQKTAAATAALPDIDFRELHVLMEQLKETAKLKRDKAGEFQRKGRDCRAKNDEKGARINGAACVKRQDEALEVDKLYINLDNLFEILQSRKLTEKSVVQMRNALAFLHENMAESDLNAIEQFSDELAAAIDSSREITELVSHEHFAGNSVVSNRAMNRVLQNEFDSESDSSHAEANRSPAPTGDAAQIVLDDDEDEEEEDTKDATLRRQPRRLFKDRGDGYETVPL